MIADDPIPEGAFARLFCWLRRLPVAAATYLFTQTTTRPVRDLDQRLRAAGFTDISDERMWSGSFLIIHAVKEGS